MINFKLSLDLLLRSHRKRRYHRSFEPIFALARLSGGLPSPQTRIEATVCRLPARIARFLTDAMRNPRVQPVGS